MNRKSMLLTAAVAVGGCFFLNAADAQVNVGISISDQAGSTNINSVGVAHGTQPQPPRIYQYVGGSTGGYTQDLTPGQNTERIFVGATPDTANATALKIMNPSFISTRMESRENDGTRHATNIIQTSNEIKLESGRSQTIMTPELNISLVSNPGRLAMTHKSEAGVYSGNFDGLSSSNQLNGIAAQFDGSTDMTRIGSYGNVGTLRTGLQVDGITGTNTLVGRTITNGIDNNGNKIAGVQAGEVSATSTDAVNGSQLYSTNAALSGLQSAQNAQNAINGYQSDVNTKQDSINRGQAEVNQGQSETNSRQGEVNNGQKAFNLGQVEVNNQQAEVNRGQGEVNKAQAGINDNQAVVNTAQQSTNEKFAGQIRDNRRMASAGIATVMASAAIPALERDKKVGVGIGVGSYDGRSAIAVGVAARVSEQLQLRLSVGGGNGSKTAIGVGGMYAW